MLKKIKGVVIALMLTGIVIVSCSDDKNLVGPGDDIIPEGMVFVQGDTFDMGNRITGEGWGNELPIHSVSLNSFYMGKYEVTQAEWQTVMTGNNNGISATPSHFSGPNKPVEMVSWYDILVYCNRLSIAEGLTPVYSIGGSTNPNTWGTVPTSSNATWNAAIFNTNANGYRLPTEAEWEYAARGGIHHTDNLRYAGCHETSDLTNYAWYSANSGSQTHDVGTKLPNQLGLYDMSGNVWEWCWDWYGSNYYSSSPSDNPVGPDSGSSRVIRGGSWNYFASLCRVANRDYSTPSSQCYDLGFRLVCSSV